MSKHFAIHCPPYLDPLGRPAQRIRVNGITTNRVNDYVYVEPLTDKAFDLLLSMGWSRTTALAARERGYACNDREFAEYIVKIMRRRLGETDNG